MRYSILYAIRTSHSPTRPISYGITTTIRTSGYSWVRGRLLTAYIIQHSYAAISTIAGLKWLRILSLAGWISAILTWNAILSSWRRTLDLPDHVSNFLSIFLPCSITVAIAVGWVACMELSIAFITSLLSGHILFNAIAAGQSKKISASGMIVTILLGVISIFLYQPMFGVFLLPFFIQYLQKRKYNRTFLTGIAVFLLVHIIYFFFFKYSLRIYGVAANNRAELGFNPLDKLSFFISQPLAQAFSFNFLYNLSGIFSQAFYPLMFAGWLVTVFIDRYPSLKQKIIYILTIIGIFALIYISILISVQNFAAYRTMLPLNLAATILTIQAATGLFKKDRAKNIFVYTGSAIIIVAGWYNFNINYLSPLKKEYAAVNAWISRNYNDRIEKIYFVRPPEDLFKNLYHIDHYKDEFGLPSTYKDWTPEPLTRQIVFELTGSRSTASRLEIINMPAGPGGNESPGQPKSTNTMLVDIRKITSQ